MKRSDEAGRISRLCAALARITASLDPETVLREIVEGARALTSARYGSITTVDESGGPQDFVTSGLSAEGKLRLTNCLPDGLRLFEHLRDQEAPLRVDDFPAHLRSVGLSEEMGLCRTFQGTPIRHRGVHVGNFFVGDKEGGGGFTDEDEELLVLFASQAAGAIANARAHREERRARAGRAREAGAADYIVKPFSAAELTARVRAALRRTDGAEPFVLGDLAIDYERRLVSIGGRPVELTATEYELLRTLSVNAGRVTSFDSLLRKVWARREDADVQSVRNFVKKLRRKLGDDPASPAWIRNVRGVGYSMPKPDEA